MKAEKSVLFLTPFFPPYDKGGMELSLKLLAEALAEGGWKVEIATPGYGLAVPKSEGNNPRVHYIPWSTKQSPSSLFTPLAARRFAKAVSAMAAKPSLIDAYAWPQPGTVLKSIWKVPLVASIRDATFISDLRATAQPVRQKLLAYLTHRFQVNGAKPIELLFGLYGYWRTSTTWNHLKKADHITYASEALKELFHNLPVPGTAIYSVANPPEIKLPELIIPERKPELPLFIYAGRLNGGKGARFTYEACCRLLERGARFQIAFIGSGDLENTLKNNPWPDFILPLGRKNREETAAAMKLATATIVPSLVFEGFPRAAIESISQGTPVIGTEVGGIPEAAGKAGLLISPGDGTALEKAILKFMDDKAFLDSMQKAARSASELYSAQRMRDRVESIYTNLLA